MNSTTREYVKNPVMRICGTCDTMHSCKMAGYRQLMDSRGVYEHFCSAACLKSFVNLNRQRVMTHDAAVIRICVAGLLMFAAGFGAALIGFAQ